MVKIPRVLKQKIGWSEPLNIFSILPQFNLGTVLSMCSYHCYNSVPFLSHKHVLETCGASLGYQDKLAEVPQISVH